MKLAREVGVGDGMGVGRVEVQNVEQLAKRLAEFVRPYQAAVGWASREKHLGAFVAGLVGGSERKSVEPIALAQGANRRQLQHFVGVSVWDHRPLLAQLQAEVAQELGDPEGVLVIDGSAMPKKGSESVGVTRQWCGRLGKVENCQVGVYLAYAGRGSCALVDERLYLPRAWAGDPERRRKAKVPQAVKFQKPWQLADEMLRQVGPRLPTGGRWPTRSSAGRQPSAIGSPGAARSTCSRFRRTSWYARWRGCGFRPIVNARIGAS